MSSRSRMKLPIVWWLVGLLLLILVSSVITHIINDISPSHRIGNLAATSTPHSGCRTTLCSGPNPAFNANGLPNVIDTWNNIHSFLTFDYNVANPSAVAPRYDYEWGTSVANFTSFHSANPRMYLSYYIPFHRDNGTFADDHAYQSVAYWRSTHPDWILYKCDRVTPAYEYESPNVPFDFTNPAVIAWQIQTYALPASAGGYDAIAADNVDLGNWYGACGVYKHGQWVQRYSGRAEDPQWIADISNWLAQMQSALHTLPRPLALIPNLAPGKLSLSDLRMQQLVSHVDGLLDEDGFTRSGHGFLTDSNWVDRVRFMVSVQAQGKPYYSINQLHVLNRSAIQWALASYLMAKEHVAALFISTYQGYGIDAWHNEYNAQIGSPTGEMYRSQHVYWRDYTQGVSIVNPNSTVTYTVTLSAGVQYKDLYGNIVGPTLTLSPHSGIVLLK